MFEKSNAMTQFVPEVSRTLPELPLCETHRKQNACALYFSVKTYYKVNSLRQYSFIISYLCKSKVHIFSPDSSA
jgi:hypothetical protein